jgi:GNAT superfamily N-acetyltransferase
MAGGQCVAISNSTESIQVIEGWRGVMRIEVTDRPREEDEAYVIARTREYNAAFAENDIRSLCVFLRDESGRIIGGLSARTYWRYLDIAFLWVSDRHRGQDLGTKLMDAAEDEARTRGCERVFLDTLSFQALGFYQKRGYAEFGCLAGFSGKHDRHYLCKSLGESALVK